jgi:hypothetical protein
VVHLPSLDHELLDNAVESGALITEALLASGQSTRIVRKCHEIIQVPECLQAFCGG